MVKNEFNLSISTGTVRRTLHKEGLINSEEGQKPHAPTKTPKNEIGMVPQIQRLDSAFLSLPPFFSSSLSLSHTHTHICLSHTHIYNYVDHCRRRKDEIGFGTTENMNIMPKV